jgi:hypothetical protein
VVESRNMINSTYGGELALRELGGVCFRGSFEFEIFFCFDAFLTICWFYSFFLILDDLLKLFFGF